MKKVLSNKKAEMYVNKSVGIIIAVFIGALILAGVYGLLKSSVDTASEKVGDLFSYSGGSGTSNPAQGAATGGAQELGPHGQQPEPIPEPPHPDPYPWQRTY